MSLEQDQKRCLSFSDSSSQKEKFGSSCTPILVKNSLVDLVPLNTFIAFNITFLEPFLLSLRRRTCFLSF